MARNAKKMPKNALTSLEIAKELLKWAKIAKVGQKWPKRDKNG